MQCPGCISTVPSNKDWICRAAKSLWIQLKPLDQRILSAILKFRVCLLLLAFASPITRSGIFRHVTSAALCTAHSHRLVPWCCCHLLNQVLLNSHCNSAIAWGAFPFMNPSFSRVCIVQQWEAVKALQYPLQKVIFHVGCLCLPPASQHRRKAAVPELQGLQWGPGRGWVLSESVHLLLPIV